MRAHLVGIIGAAFCLALPAACSDRSLPRTTAQAVTVTSHSGWDYADGLVETAEARGVNLSDKAGQFDLYLGHDVASGTHRAQEQSYGWMFATIHEMLVEYRPADSTVGFEAWSEDPGDSDDYQQSVLLYGLAEGIGGLPPCGDAGCGAAGCRQCATNFPGHPGDWAALHVCAIARAPDTTLTLLQVTLSGHPDLAEPLLIAEEIGANEDQEGPTCRTVTGLDLSKPWVVTFLVDNGIPQSLYQQVPNEANKFWVSLSEPAAPANTPPDCSAAAADPAVVWPPNHKMVSVVLIGITDPDGDDVGITVTGITQDEPLDDRGDGHTEPDATLSPTRVRAERSGLGDGRVYRLHFTADDGREGVCTGVVTVCVPHDQRPGGTCVDSGQSYDAVTTTQAEPGPGEP